MRKRYNKGMHSLGQGGKSDECELSRMRRLEVRRKLECFCSKESESKLEPIPEGRGKLGEKVVYKFGRQCPLELDGIGRQRVKCPCVAK